MDVLVLTNIEVVTQSDTFLFEKDSKIEISLDNPSYPPLPKMTGSVINDTIV